jgi:hypothetical protein
MGRTTARETCIPASLQAGELLLHLVRKFRSDGALLVLEIRECLGPGWLFTDGLRPPINLRRSIVLASQSKITEVCRSDHGSLEFFVLRDTKRRVRRAQGLKNGFIEP